MTFKKTALALAISSAALLPATSQADVYGFVSAGIENASITGGGADGIFASGPDGSTHAQDVAESRFGFKDSKKLDNGMTASVKMELGLGTSYSTGGPGTAGAVNEDAGPTTRIAQVGLSGDFGSVTVGTQWGILYEYLGWNIFRSSGHGGGIWYHTTGHINDDQYGLRVDNAFTYTYGGGGYSADPFTFSVQVVAEPDTATNDAFADAIVLGAGFTTGNLTINAVSYTESDGSAAAAEPSIIGVGARFNLSSDTYIGGTYMSVDKDSAGQKLSSINVLLTQNLGDGLSGMVGVGSSSGKGGVAEVDSSVFLQLEKDLGAGVSTYVEFETAKMSTGAKTQVLAANLKYGF